MYGWLVRNMIRSALRSQQQGDLGPLLSKAADDVHFRFPGKSSWTADIHGKENLEPWIRRFMDAGLVFEPQQVDVAGWPWNTRIYIQFKDHGKDVDGNIIYENEGVIAGRIVWGKIVSYTVYEDTQKVAELDDYFEAQSGAPAST